MHYNRDDSYLFVDSTEFARICAPDTIKNLNVKVFNLMSLTNEARDIEWHESFKCICRLDPIICNNKQQLNEDVCDKGFIWNPSNCECECDKSCNNGEYLGYSNCKCKKKLYDKLVEEFTENIDMVKIDNENENENGNEHKYKIGVNTDDDIPLDKPLKFPSLTIIIRCVF